MVEIVKFLKEFLIDEAWGVVIALWIIGLFIKETPKVKDWIIPFILLPFGILGTVSLMGFNPDGILQGVIVTGVAVYGNQLIKQAMERD